MLWSFQRSSDQNKEFFRAYYGNFFKQCDKQGITIFTWADYYEPIVIDECNRKIQSQTDLIKFYRSLGFRKLCVVGEKYYIIRHPRSKKCLTRKKS